MTLTAKNEKCGAGSTAELTHGGELYSPRVDIVETQDGLILYGELPGVGPENLEIRYDNGQLVIHGQVKPRSEESRYLSTEYGVGDFYREFRIGEAIDAGKIAADINSGVLVLHLPKTEKLKPRRIEVKAG